jgi:hypothetical protein
MMRSRIVFTNAIYKNFRNIYISRCLIRSKKTLLAPKTVNRCGIRHLSIKQDVNIVEVFIDYISENNSGSNDPIYDDSKLDFDWQSGQKLFFELVESASAISYHPNSLAENEIFLISTQLYETKVTSNNKVIKMSCSKVPNELVQNNQSSMMILRIIK